VSTVFAKAPLRVSFGGGGTDLPSYYRDRGGLVVSAAIDKHVYMLVTSGFQSRFRLKHLEWEEADRHDDITHPILREALARHWSGGPLEIASVADAPPGTGLGSSGAYTLCVLSALRRIRGEELHPADLAELASELEIDVLGRTVGKQDQYVSAHGGLCALTFNPDDSVDVRALELDRDTAHALGERLMLFYSGEARSAAEMFGDQVSGSLAGDTAVAARLDRTKELAVQVSAALEGGDLGRCAELMNEQWLVKRERGPGTVTERIDELRELALGAGAAGVSLMGAGGGGFLLVYAEDPGPVRATLEAADAPELPFELTPDGCEATLYR
jgi:D-glycero-alpha-D-manno-heptose-7-phosphate kinase